QASANDPLAFAQSLLQRDLSPETKSAIGKVVNEAGVRLPVASTAKAPQAQIPSLIAGVTLGAPEFQHR
ncbi:MAG: hypothetical protein ACJ74Y_05030, partial [Bryobacteraceae bacterium]